MNKLNPKIRFIIFVVIIFFIFGGFGWYNYGIYSHISKTEQAIKNFDVELKTQDQVRNNILEAQKQRVNGVSDLKKNVFFTMREYELAAVKMKKIAKKYDIDVLSLNLRSQNTFPDLNNFTKIKRVPIERLQIDLRLSGKFLEVGPFFDDVEEQIKLVNLHSYKFSLDQNAAEQVIADIVYYTYQMEEEPNE